MESRGLLAGHSLRAGGYLGCRWWRYWARHHATNPPPQRGHALVSALTSSPLVQTRCRHPPVWRTRFSSTCRIESSKHPRQRPRNRTTSTKSPSQPNAMNGNRVSAVSTEDTACHACFSDATGPQRKLDSDARLARERRFSTGVDPFKARSDMSVLHGYQARHRPLSVPFSPSSPVADAFLLVGLVGRLDHEVALTKDCNIALLAHSKEADAQTRPRARGDRLLCGCYGFQNRWNGGMGAGNSEVASALVGAARRGYMLLRPDSEDQWLAISMWDRWSDATQGWNIRIDPKPAADPAYEWTV
jgi:hypothetical protein